MGAFFSTYENVFCVSAMEDENVSDVILAHHEVILPNKNVSMQLGRQERRQPIRA